jgi:hypothetical protein
VQKYDDMVCFAILSMNLEGNIIIRDISNNSLVHSTGNCLDVHGLTTKSDQKIFNVLIAHLMTSLRLIHIPFNKHQSITVRIEHADKSTTPAFIAR